MRIVSRKHFRRFDPARDTRITEEVSVLNHVSLVFFREDQPDGKESHFPP